MDCTGDERMSRIMRPFACSYKMGKWLPTGESIESIIGYHRKEREYAEVWPNRVYHVR